MARKWAALSFLLIRVLLVGYAAFQPVKINQALTGRDVLGAALDAEVPQRSVQMTDPATEQVERRGAGVALCHQGFEPIQLEGSPHGLADQDSLGRRDFARPSQIGHEPGGDGTRSARMGAPTIYIR